MPRLPESKPPFFRSISVLAGTAGSLVLGVCFGGLIPNSPGPVLCVLSLWLVVAALLLFARSKLALAAAYIAIVFIGAGRWQLCQYSYEQNTIRQTVTGRHTVRLNVTITSIPVVSVRPSTAYAPRMYGSPQRTQFLARANYIQTEEERVPVTGQCQVYVDGDASSVVCSGDRVLMLGKLDWPGPPGNPGEFDYRAFLKRRRISSTVFVNHPRAIEVVDAAGVLSAGRLTTWLRQSARSAIISSVDPEFTGVALALLLGNRHQLPPEIEEAFVASGTMHLLAISGLHIGIMCLFLLRLSNLMLIKRRNSLLLTAAVCVMYAAMTDLRPSVVRATVFFLVFVAGQLFGRNQRPGNLIAVTVILMVSVWPEWVFDTGAWLSFLSVVSLAWVSSILSTHNFNASEAPADSISVRETIRNRMGDAAKWLKLRYLQMICILAFTTPLVASTFHVISPVGLLVNVLLIAVAFAILCFGFLTVFLGMLLPAAAAVPGRVFSEMLRAVTWVVELTSDVSGGHLYVPDFPVWFVPCYYTLLVLSLVVRRTGFRKMAICGLMCCIVAAFGQRQISRPKGELLCTVLSVGHGSAAVLETPGGRVFVVDAGAMNRGSRAANVVCSYLWSRGLRKIDGLLISHADLDHYNAVPDVMRRVPVAELLTSSEFARSNSSSVQAVLEFSRKVGVPVRVLQNGDRALVDDAEIRIRQVLPNASADDNQQSLVVELNYGGKRILLPGDLEGNTAHQLLNEVGDVDLLVSPHHGSSAANLPAVAEAVQPDYLVVSARNATNRRQLEETYASSRAVLFTSTCGAITARLHPGRPLEISTYLNR